ncbi:hypothetical protein AB0D49_17265 [Streptomyces sp. NPDC048290]|uniref:hypothetical protein n=1 Tax=Streptomyces sp. NPDC048290 TaxID=3155811 RepID=UPI003424FACC
MKPVLCDPFPTGFAPVPVDGCAICTELGARQRKARDAGNQSALTDANVLLRRHVRQAHGS